MAKATRKTAQLTADLEDARAAVFEQFLVAQNKDKPGSVMRLDDPGLQGVEVIPTGAISLDAALGVGGVPRGRIIELFGLQMSGKTSLALSIAANAQKTGGFVGFIDAEHSLAREHAINMGVDPHRLAIYQPDSGEDGLRKAISMCDSGAFDVIIIDSVAALVPQAEIDGDLEQGGMALHARMMSKALRVMGPAVAKSGAVVIFINQLRTNLGAYGAPDTTTGGKALPFYASVRIRITGNSKGAQIVQNKEVVGQTCKATVVKNKVAPPHREAEYELYFNGGIAAEASLVDVCKDLGLIKLGGAIYTVELTGEKFQGKERLKAELAANAPLREALTAAVYAHLRGEGEDNDNVVFSGDEDGLGYEGVEAEDDTAAADGLDEIEPIAI